LLLKDYEYALPLKNVVSCPTFASFKFACPPRHVISLEELFFSPISIGTFGECTSDRALECRDESSAFEYARAECSGNESCTLISYQLRAKTACNHHHVISIYFKCVPTWEVTEVPIKCDICKNVTINVYNDMFGFIHSAWYPKLYPRLACSSVIKNQPGHFILVYAVTGTLGLDRVIFETVSGVGQYGQPLVVKEILSGNLSTQLVFMSENDIKLNLLAEDQYFNEQRKFLLYFYLVPKCFIIECKNETTVAPGVSYGQPVVSYGQPAQPFYTMLPPSTRQPPYGSVASSLSSSGYIATTTTQAAYYAISSSSQSGYVSQGISIIYGQTTPTTSTTSTTTTTVVHSTYAPPLIADRHNDKKPAALSGILLIINNSFGVWSSLLGDGFLLYQSLWS
jgi:hypothetical protein